MRRWTSLLAALALPSCALLEPATGAAHDLTCVDADSDPSAAVSFARDIRPMMNRLKEDPAPGCASCHYTTAGSGAGTTESGLDPKPPDALRRGGRTTGASIVVPGKPCASGLIMKLRGTYATGVRMPKDATRPWNEAEIQRVIDWIAEGATGGAGE